MFYILDVLVNNGLLLLRWEVHGPKGCFTSRGQWWNTIEVMTATVKCIDNLNGTLLTPPQKNTFHRFYIEKITFLKENTTVELFFLNAKALVFNVSILLVFCPVYLTSLVFGMPFGYRLCQLFFKLCLQDPTLPPFSRPCFWHYSKRCLDGALEFWTKVNKTLISRIAYV